MIEAFAVVTITLLAVISPGADFAMVTRNSMVLSRRAGLLTSVGISLGVLVHVAYSMAGIGLVISKSILLFSIIKYVGAAYLIYLGITMLRAKKAEQGQIDSTNLPISDFAALRIGFLTNALNPKTTLFVVALFSQVISPSTPIAVQFGYGAFMSVAHLVWFALVAYAFSSEAAKNLAASSRHIIERSIGAVLVTLGVGLAATSMKRA
ncbi:lysine transporter LysE [Litchfieldella qijiaojingensis]|uniref:Lysine transporter LysE n=1 Tax=Litchfieldella qijiaojingensis TaxID=980347 RepID=A0ABQ2YND7_9GAMM|nr:LysE family transporter [Halomonas qijiaojingensis]GGX88055.1 lysine transporter LysE [Halomonas qijiaojingensis]